MSLTAFNEPYYSAILGDTPASNLIEQPRNIGTAPAILYSVLKDCCGGPQAVVAFFPSDHYISDNRIWLYDASLTDQLRYEKAPKQNDPMRAIHGHRRDTAFHRCHRHVRMRRLR